MKHEQREWVKFKWKDKLQNIYFVLKDNFTTQENCNTSDFWKMIAQSAINHPSKIAFDHTLASRQIPIHISKGPTKYLKDRLVFLKTLSQNYVCRTYGVRLQTVEPHTRWKSAFIQDSLNVPFWMAIIFGNNNLQQYFNCNGCFQCCFLLIHSYTWNLWSF